MGICFSTRGKKKKSMTTEPSSSSCSRVPPPPAALASVVISPPPAAVAEAEISLRPAAPSEETTPAPNALPCSSKPTAEHAPPPAYPSQSSKSEEAPSKKPIFLITPSKTRKPASSESADDPLPPAALRTSNCTKEEVESILIQCGHLSRSSSGNADCTARRYSGSKRSFDFDAERKDGDDWEVSLNSSARPSPRQRAQNRERESGGGRRVSRSPGRRTEQQQVTTGSRPQQQQPGKMVSVPAREKSSASGPERRTSSHRSGPVRSSSPRSRSPGITRVPANENCQQHHNNAHGGSQQQPLSRSSSRKAEQSPYRRNPMAEIDDNQPPLGLAGEGLKKKKVPQNPPQFLPHQRSKSEEDEQQQADRPPGPMDPKPITRSRSSRRSSRDLDAFLGNPQASSYASLLLEDINNYHQSTTPFSLPACVSKACSILDAVADLNHDSFSSNGQPGSRGFSQKHSFTEADFSQSLSFQNKYVCVRNKALEAGEPEPQESAGSNSFVGQQQWGAGSCQGNAGEQSSSERCWTSSWSGQEEEVEGGVSNSCSVQKGGSSVGSGRRRELENQRRMRRGMGGGAGTTVARACSPAAASATSY